MADDIGLSALESIEANADVLAITTRIKAGVLDQNETLPAAIVDVVTNNAVEHLRGSAVSVARIRVDAYGTTRTAANTLAETIRTKVMKANHKGTLGVSNPINVREISIISGPYWNRDTPRDGSSQWRQFVRIDYLVTYIQTGPS